MIHEKEKNKSDTKWRKKVVLVVRPEMRSNCMKSTITMFVSVVVVDSCSCNHLETALSQRLATEDLTKEGKAH